MKGEYEGYSNRAISQTSMAVGAGTTAGMRGWYYRDYTGNIITILTTQPSLKNGHLNGGTLANESDVKQAFKVGDVVSFVNHQKYDKYAKVVSVQGNTITLDKEITLSEEVTYNNIDDWSIFLPDKPHLGAIDFGFGAFSEGGYNTMATNICAHAEGLQTHAYGQYSHTEGRETEAGYAAHAEGLTTYAKGYASHAEGVSTQALASQSHSEGEGSIANGQRSHVEGYYTIANNQAEHAEGKFNQSNKDKTIHSIGIGTSNTNRKNAHEITNDGKHYIINIAGYDGTNPTSTNDLVSYLIKLENRIKELEDKLNEITTSE